MLKYFSVSGYKNFNDPIELDFSDVRDYRFSTECISNGLLSKIIVYGKNAAGKSNFANALFDICNLRIDFSKIEKDDFYLNVSNTKGYAEFRYVFQFGKNTVDYSYRKTPTWDLLYEKIIIDNELLVEYDRERPDCINAENLQKLLPNLGSGYKHMASLLYLIAGNMPYDIPYEMQHPTRKAVEFIYNLKMGISWEFMDSSLSRHIEHIIKVGRVDRFEDFLHTAGVNEKLVVHEDPSGKQVLYFDVKPPLPFYQAASSGTKALCGLFMLYVAARYDERPQMFILDEFDAFYHYELAEQIVRMFLSLPNVQVIFTSHNTLLLTNRYMRPDCCFIISNGRLVALPNATNMELREGHNLQKLFIGGEFSE